MHCSAVVLSLFVLVAAVLAFTPTPTPVPVATSNYTNPSGFAVSAPAAGQFQLTFQAVATAGGFNASDSYTFSLYDIQETTFDSKGNIKWNTGSRIGFDASQTNNTFATVQTDNKNGATFTSTASANARFKSLQVVNQVPNGAMTGNIETTIKLDGYEWTTNATDNYLSLRFYLTTSGDKCKVNTACNASAVVQSASNQSAVVINSGLFYTSASALVTGNANGTAVTLTYTNGAIVLSYAHFSGDLTHDPTVGLLNSTDAPVVVPVGLQSTWWFGWSYTTWYIILAVVGVIVLLALVALIGAIIVWNRGKPGYEQV